MKRYLLFGGCDYYAAGGMHDFIHDFDTCGDAIAAAGGLQRSEEWSGVEWWHVYDAMLGICPAASEFGAHGAPECIPTMGRRIPDFAPER